MNASVIITLLFTLCFMPFFDQFSLSNHRSSLTYYNIDQDCYTTMVSKLSDVFELKNGFFRGKIKRFIHSLTCFCPFKKPYDKPPVIFISFLTNTI